MASGAAELTLVAGVAVVVVLGESGVGVATTEEAPGAGLFKLTGSPGSESVFGGSSKGIVIGLSGGGGRFGFGDSCITGTLVLGVETGVSTAGGVTGIGAEAVATGV